MHVGLMGYLLHSLAQHGMARETDAHSDSDLLRRFSQAADQDAFAALVCRHGSMVLAVCQRLLPDCHEAEDAFQATFLVLVNKSSVLRQPHSLAPWLYGVARRIALRLRRRALRFQPLPDGLELAEESAPPPLDRLAWQEVRTVLDEEIERLPSKYRLPVILCYLQGQSYTEAARSLGWPAGTVSVRLARARQRLRDRLVRRGLGLSASLLGTLLGQELMASTVSAALRKATVNAAVHAVAGASVLAGVSPQVIALVEGALQTMWMTKFKTVLLLVVVTGLLCSGLGGLAWYQAAQAGGQAPLPQAVALPEPVAPEKGPDQEKNLPELEKQLQALQEQLQAKQRQLDRLRQTNALDQIEAALKQLKQANAGEPRRRAAVDEFEQAFSKLKHALNLPNLAAVSTKMDAIKERLDKGFAGKKTQILQQELLDQMDDVIREWENVLKNKDDAQLRGLLAEMKLIRAMQKRINVRTEISGKQFKGESIPQPETTRDLKEKEQLETVWRELKELSNRQDKVSKITQAILPAKKDGQ